MSESEPLAGVAGVYTNLDATVDEQGRIVAAASGTGGGGGKMICLDAFVEAYTSAVSGQHFFDAENGIAASWVVDFDRLSTPNIDVQLVFFAPSVNGGDAIVKVGATAPTVDNGTTRATATVSGVPATQNSGVSSFTRPSGRQIVQLYANNRVVGESVFIIFKDQ